MKCGLAIFVKTPAYSPLKTRLAASVGGLATQWYQAAANAVASVAKCMPDISTYWAVAETQAIQDKVWKTFPALAQGEGGLGERMGRVHRMLVRQHGCGLLIGADAPQIQSQDLQNAFEFLSHDAPRWVIGPASDGGFWCVGANRIIPMEVWTSVSYSQARTREDFLSRLAHFGELLILRELTDVDDENDWEPCLHALATLEAPTDEQTQLFDWMQTALPVKSEA